MTHPIQTFARSPNRMKSNQTVDKIEIADIPWSSWALAGALVIALAVVGARLWATWDTADQREIAVEMLSLAIFMIGIIFLSTKPALSCTIDGAKREIVIEEGGLLNSSSEGFEFYQVATCYLETWRHADNSTCYRAGLRLKSGESRAISNWETDRTRVDELVRTVRLFVNV